MNRDIIEINKELIPYAFDIQLAGEIFNIRVDYNETADLFTFSLSKDDKIICAGEPLMYGKALWEDMYQPETYPAIRIIPYDESGENDRLTYKNLGKTVFLVIDNDEKGIV